MTALRRAAASHLFVVIAALVIGAGIAGGALVGFSAEDQNASSTFAAGWLGAPTGLGTPTVSGNGATLSWTPATHGLTDQALYGTDQGTTSNCTGATYATSFNASLGVATSTTTDDRGGSASGHYICYQLRSIRTGTSWTKTANFGVVQVGLIGSTVTVSGAGGGSGGQIDNGDTITLTFNQNVTYTGSGTITVCVFKSTANSILIGDTGCAAAGDTPTIGSLTGLSIPNANRTFASSTVSATGNTIVITIGGGANGATGRTAVTGTGTFTFTGNSTVIQSSAGAAGVCTAANCTWTYSGGF